MKITACGAFSRRGVRKLSPRRENAATGKTNSIMRHLRLKYIGMDFNGRPAYKEEGGSMIYVDVHLAKKKGENHGYATLYQRAVSLTVRLSEVIHWKACLGRMNR